MFSVKFDKDFEFDGSCCSVKIKFPDQFFNSTPILFGVKFRDYATAQKRERRLSKIFSRLLLEKGVLLKHWIFLQNLYPGIAEKFEEIFLALSHSLFRCNYDFENTIPCNSNPVIGKFNFI